MRAPTWNNIGTDVSTTRTVQEVLTVAGLNYEVVKEPIYLENGFEVPGSFATKIEGTNKVFGIVGGGYEVVQNADAFEFVNNIVPEGLEFVKAGSVNDGKIVYLIASLPETYILEDKFKPYVIFQNSHCGLSTLKASINPLRCICQNQFSAEFKRSSNKISLRHSAGIRGKMEEAHSVLALNAEYMNTVKKVAKDLSQTKISHVQSLQIVDKFYEVNQNATDRVKALAADRKQALLAAYNGADDLQNHRGTAWGLVQAYSDVITHSEPKKTENWQESRFMKVSLDGKAFDKLFSLIQAAA